MTTATPIVPTPACVPVRAVRVARRGFTIIEVMIVLVIVLALSALVGVAVFARQDEAKDKLTRTDFETIKNALGLFRLDYGRWPTDEEGLAVLWDKGQLDPEADEAAWKGYLDEPMRTDRWNGEWGYRQISENTAESNYDLWSNGPDGEEGTEDDITSWENLTSDGEGGDLLPPPPAGG